MQRYPQRSIAHPGRVLLIWLAVIALGAAAIALVPQLRMNPTFRSMIMSDDPDREADDRAKQIFGDDEFITIAIENPQGIFNLPTLAFIDQITRKVQGVEGVRQVYSLTRVDNIRGRDGTLIADDLITELPRTPEDVQRVEREAFENPLYVNNIIAADKKVASINVELDLSHTTSEAHAAITKAVYRIMDETEPAKPAGVKTYVTGYPVGSYIGGVYMIEDMVLFGGASFVVLLTVMWLVFRRWQGVLATLLVVMASLSVSYGVMSIAGVAVTMPLSAVMVFLTALGMQYSTYVGFAHRERVYHERGHGRPPPRDHRYILSEAMRDVRGSVGLSAVVTAVGFGSMFVNRIPDLRMMGLFLVIGLVTTSLGVMTIIPAVIAKFPFEVPDQNRHHYRLQQIIDRMGRVSTSRPWLMLSISGVIFALGIFGVTRLDNNTDAMHYFKKSAEVRQAEDFVRSRMAGTTYLQAVVAAPQVDAFKEPENLRKLAAIQRYAESLPHVTKTVSHADHISLMNRALRGGGAAEYRIPDTKAAIEQYLLLHNKPDEFRLWMDSDYRNASVMIRMDTMSSAVQRETEDKLEAFMQQQFPGWDVNLVGTNLLTHRAFDEMSTSMLQSLGLATILIWLIMCIGLGSFKLGTLSLIPNLAPSIIVYAFLPLLGQPLDPPTAVTGAVALGILSDDTVHFIKTWLGHRRRGNTDAVSAVLATLSEVGKPMILSSVVVMIGFSIMLLSRYGTLVWTGIMMCIVTSTAVLWELVCSPALLRLVGKRALKPVSEESTSLEDFRKVYADDRRTSFADYSDEEITYMTTADFLALAGKTVIRHGGSNGTRRMLVELDVKPNHRILEVGAGVGATAFYLVANDPNIRVTGVDLSTFMIEQARKRADAMGFGDRVELVHTSEPTVLPFEDNTFDIVMCESVAMYNESEPFFRELFRVLKPGGRLGVHDWCWIGKPEKQLEVVTCVIACGCNPGDVKFYTQADWERSLTDQGFEIHFAEEYPFTFFSFSSMADDEGTWGLMKMFGRVLSRKATARRMFRMTAFLARHEGEYGYTVTVGRKPMPAAAAAEAQPTPAGDAESSSERGEASPA
ncbi:MAG TPA: MMPL family transporter [Kofleriaceae bacterium]|nr:MMPL family transporter [Kofleriaceae bacterium]